MYSNYNNKNKYTIPSKGCNLVQGQDIFQISFPCLWLCLPALMCLSDIPTIASLLMPTNMFLHPPWKNKSFILITVVAIHMINFKHTKPPVS